MRLIGSEYYYLRKPNILGSYTVGVSMKNFIKYVLKVLENKLNSLIIFNALFAGSLLIVSGCLYEHLGRVFVLSFYKNFNIY